MLNGPIVVVELTKLQEKMTIIKLRQLGCIV